MLDLCEMGGFYKIRFCLILFVFATELLSTRKQKRRWPNAYFLAVTFFAVAAFLGFLAVAGFLAAGALK